MTWFGSVATSVITSAITAVIVVWLTGFVDEIVPSPQKAWLKLQNKFRIKPQRTQDGFRIVLCWLENDRSGEDTKNVEDAFSGVKGISLVRSDRTITATGAADEWGPAMRRDAVAEMEKWNADVAIVGVVKTPKEVLSLWFVPRSGEGTLERGDWTYKLENATLGDDFHEDLRVQLIALAWEAVSPIADTDSRKETVAIGLREATQKLSSLLDSPSMARTEHWAALQLRFGQSLWALGEREGETDKLERAVDSYRAALEVYTRERWPLRWAEVQAHLAIALKTLGERESATGRLEQAASANLAALEVYTRETRPFEWAAVQGNLGIVLQRLGERESGTKHLELAARAARTALGVFTRELSPRQWATGQQNLGNALWTLAERESGTEQLIEAMEAYRRALEVFTREGAPQAWATTHNNIGAVLTRLGERENRSDRFEEAINAYRTALQERTRERAPLDWAVDPEQLGCGAASAGRTRKQHSTYT